MNTASAFEATGTLPIPPLPTEHFRVVKTSRQGHRYYFKGSATLIETADEICVLVADPGLLPGDARLFSSELEASQMALALNAWPVSDAFWTVEPADV